MSLIDTMTQPCVMMDNVTASDGMGGTVHTWKEGAEFQAAIVKDNTLNARIAEKDGVTEVYTITVAKNVALDFHDVFKRVSDGMIFRVTSNIVDSKTPKVASFSFGQVTAERWKLP